MADAPSTLQNADFGRTTEFLQEFVGGFFKPKVVPTPSIPLSPEAQAREGLTAAQMPVNGDEVAPASPIAQGPLTEVDKAAAVKRSPAFPWVIGAVALAVVFVLAKKG